MDELRGVEVRLVRAKEHIDALQHESMMFMLDLPKPYGFTIPDEAIDGEYIVRAKIIRPPPIRLGVLAADGAHNLRAALDMLAWELALKGPKPPSDDDRKTAFPICNNPHAWESGATKRMLKWIGEDAVKMIHSFQPYNRPGKPPRLMVIQAIDNWAKHHAIPNLVSFGISRFQITSRFEIVSQEQRIVEDGDEICRVRRIEPISDPNEHLQATMKCHVGFARNAVGYGWPIDFLSNAHGEIRDEILPAFQRFFP